MLPLPGISAGSRGLGEARWVKAALPAEFHWKRAASTFFLSFLIFIYVAALGLGYGMSALQLWCVGFQGTGLSS